MAEIKAVDVTPSEETVEILRLSIELATTTAIHDSLAELTEAARHSMIECAQRLDEAKAKRDKVAPDG